MDRELVRYCAHCDREVPVTLTVGVSTIRVDCRQCWSSYELPRFGPDEYSDPG